jgi:hypothetical protein
MPITNSLLFFLSPIYLNAATRLHLQIVVFVSFHPETTTLFIQIYQVTMALRHLYGTLFMYLILGIFLHKDPGSWERKPRSFTKMMFQISLSDSKLQRSASVHHNNFRYRYWIPLLSDPWFCAYHCLECFT